MRVQQSSNHRPGEPLRSWLDPTDFNAADAHLTIGMAEAFPAIRRLIAGDTTTAEDTTTFARLNELCVLRWYEPMVELVDGQAQISDDLRAFLRATLNDYSAPGDDEGTARLH